MSLDNNYGVGDNGGESDISSRSRLRADGTMKAGRYMVMKHRRNWPDTAWHFDFEVPASLSDRCGELVSIAGTVSLDTKGKLRAAYDLDTQLELVMKEVEIITGGAGVELDSVAKLVAFYVGAGNDVNAQVLQAMSSRFSAEPGPALTAIPVDNLAFPGMMLEIEGYALADADGVRLPRLAGMPGTLRSGDWLFVDARGCAAGSAAGLARQTADAVENLKRCLSENEASIADVMRLNVYYRSDGGMDDLLTVGDALTAGFQTPGPVVTFVPLRELGRADRVVELDVVAMPGHDGQTPTRSELTALPGWSWPREWPFVQSKRCGDAIFIGGQPAFDAERNIIEPGDMVGQTRRVMDRVVAMLESFGATYDDVMKVGCWYNGGASVDVLKSNALIRTSYMNSPGGTSTGVPVQTCFAAGLEIQVDIVAMATRE